MGECYIYLFFAAHVQKTFSGVVSFLLHLTDFSIQKQSLHTAGNATGPYLIFLFPICRQSHYCTPYTFDIFNSFFFPRKIIQKMSFMEYQDISQI